MSMPSKQASSGSILLIDLVTMSLMLFYLTGLILTPCGGRPLEDISTWILLYVWNLLFLFNIWSCPIRSPERRGNVRAAISVIAISAVLWLAYMGLLIAMILIRSADYRAKLSPQYVLMGGSAYLLIVAIWAGCRKPGIKSKTK